MKFLFTVLVISGFTRAVGADEAKITDFRIPPSSALNVTLNGGLWSEEAFGYWPWDTLNRYYRYNDFNVFGGGSFEIYYRKETEANQLQLSLCPAIGSGMSYYSQSVTGTLPSYISEYVTGSLSLNSSIELRHYLKSSLFNIWGSLDSSQYQFSISPYFPKKVIMDGKETGFIGMGIGKLRDGFYVAQAIRFGEVLQQEEKLIEAPLNKSEILDLAQLFSRTWEYKIKYWRWEKYFFADLEKTLIEKGIVKGSLPAYSLLRLREIISYAPVSERPFGFRFDCGMGGSANTIKFHPAVKFGEAFGLPLSLRSHIYQIIGLTLPFADSSSGLSFSSGNYYQYEIIDQFHIQLFDDFNYRRYDSFSQYNLNYRIQNKVGASLVFYLDNDLSLNVSGGYLISFDQRQPPLARTFDSRGTIALNLKYRIF